MTIDEKFEALCSYLADMEADVYIEDFVIRCREFCMDPDVFDNMLYEVLGLSAEDVICRYREVATGLAV